MDRTIIHILIVDDDHKMQALNRQFLTAIGFSNIDCSGDVEETKSLITNHGYDIILLDYKLPDGNGIDILSWMSEEGYKIPAIMITGQGDEEIAAQSIQCGASDYLVKGDRYLADLPKLIERNIEAHKLKTSYERSLEKIRYQALLLSNVRDAVVVWNTDGKITYWNRAAEILYNRTAEDCLDRQVKDQYLEIFEPKIRPPRPHDTAGMNIERKYLREDGEQVWVNSRVSVLRDYENSGSIIGYIDVTRDISENHRLNEEIRNSQTQLIQAARMAAMGELAAGLAHQINNPLTAVIAEAQMAMQELPENHPTRTSIEAIEEAGWVAQNAIQKLLDFSRPASTTIEMICVNQSLENALHVIRDQIHASGTTINTELAQDLPLVKGNQRQLEDLWITLLIQARDAAAPETQNSIWVRSMKGNNGHVVIEVEDSGESIPPDKLETIFEPNFIDASFGRGTGFELSICREIVRQHKGEISATRMGEIGTKMIVCLPWEYKI